MLNQELELSLNMAFARAREHRHEFMTVEHLLLALLSNPSAREALEACSVDLVALRQELEAFINGMVASHLLCHSGTINRHSLNGALLS